MIITGIETVPLRIPFKAGTKSDASAWGDSNLPAADSLLVKVTTDQGLVGWGEAFGFRAVASAKLAIDQLIAPLCVGQDATRIESLMLDVQKKLHVFGRGGALAFAISAVDIALWDIAGKAANMPLCRLLGGGATELSCYASMVRYSNPSLVRTSVRQAIDAGFGTLKRGALPAQSIFLPGDERNAYLAAEPADDSRFVAAFAHSLQHAGGYSSEEARRVAMTLLPDILRFDPTRAASYPDNGRTLTDDVLDHFLTILTNGKVTTDRVGAHSDLLAEFPYLGPPHNISVPSHAASPIATELRAASRRLGTSWGKL
jgi:L-alanine-DL-glutamate epimerase-like enolase superfamily enzyme